METCRRYLDPKRMAEYLGLSIFSVYRLVSRRDIPFIPLHPSGARNRSRPSIRFDIEAINAWMKRQSVPVVSDYVDERKGK